MTLEARIASARNDLLTMSFDQVVEKVTREMRTLPKFAHLIVRAGQVDLKMRRKPDLTNVRLPLRRKECRAGRVWWTRRSA